MTTVLITGGNKGLGRETARQLGALGWTVLLGARDARLGEEAAAKLAAGGDDVRCVPIDVTSDISVEAAAAWVEAENKVTEAYLQAIPERWPRTPSSGKTVWVNRAGSGNSPSSTSHTPCG